MSIITQKTEDSKCYSPDTCKEMKSEIISFALECEFYCMFETSAWLYELNASLNYDLSKEPSKSFVFEEDYDKIMYAVALFRCGDYARCAQCTINMTNDRAVFLHCYATYTYLEMRKSNSMPDIEYVSRMKKLESKLKENLPRRSNCGFGYYLQGKICLKLGKKLEAFSFFQMAVNIVPLLWDAWNELAKLTNRDLLSRLNLPRHWMKAFFMIKIFIKFGRLDNAFNVLMELKEKGFKRVTHILINIATCYQGQHDNAKALEFYKRAIKCDPYLIEGTDSYSNLLYALEIEEDLITLAHNALNRNRYTAETCSITGNYYSIKGDHVTSSEFFDRAIKIDPNNVSNLIVQGHEFMEMKNPNNAIQCYNAALSLNSKDFRAWFALGTTYEILKFPFQSRYYYKRAHAIRAGDSRPLAALGEIFERLDEPTIAMRYYSCSRRAGDMDNLATARLAMLYSEKSDCQDNAAECFEDLVLRVNIGEPIKIAGEAFKFLAHYYLERCMYKQAFENAERCLEYDEVKKDNKQLMLKIVQGDYHTNEHRIQGGKLAKKILETGFESRAGDGKPVAMQIDPPQN